MQLSDFKESFVFPEVPEATTLEHLSVQDNAIIEVRRGDIATDLMFFGVRILTLPGDEVDAFNRYTGYNLFNKKHVFHHLFGERDSYSFTGLMNVDGGDSGQLIQQLQDGVRTAVSRYGFHWLPHASFNAEIDRALKVIDGADDVPPTPKTEEELIDATPGMEALTEEQIQQLFVQDQPWEFYKVVEQDLSSLHGNNIDWDLPTQNDDGSWTPGAWVKFHHSPRMCSHGIHITTRPIQWLDLGATWRADRRLFKCEAKNIITTYTNDFDHDPAIKSVASTIRLLEEVDYSDPDVRAEIDRFEAAHVMRQEELREARELERQKAYEAQRLERERLAAEEEAKRVEEAKIVLADIAPRQPNILTFMNTLASAGEDHELVVFAKTSEGIVNTIRKHLPCPHCGETDWNLKRVERKKTVTTLTFDRSGSPDFEEEDEYDYDNTTEDQYTCCDSEVDYRDFQNVKWFAYGDFQDLVRTVFNNAD